MLKGEIVNISEINSDTFKQLYQLMIIHYDNVQLEKFEKDFFEKDGVLLVSDNNARVGFSTYQIIETAFKQQNMSFFFSGDTVLHGNYWGNPKVYKLAGSIFNMLLKKKIEHLYWFLIAKGYKTYIYLPLFFKCFYPRYDQKTPRFEKELTDHIAQLKFKDRYIPQSGIIVEEADMVIPEYNQIPEKKLKNKHIKHFVDLNPQFIKGDELACIAKIQRSNLTELGKRFIFG